MKNLRKVISLILLSVMLFSVTACSDNKNKSNGKREGVHSVVVEPTGKTLIKNRSSKYKIVLPENSLDYEDFAASEMKYFLELSTGYEMDVVSEPTENEKFISIGQTELLSKADIEVDSDLLKRSGYRIVTKDENVYIFGADNLEGLGTVYGVYGFLRNSINYKYFSALEIQYDRSPNVELKKFDVTDVADFETRAISNLIDRDSIYEMRMGLTPLNNYRVNIDSHSDLDILPLSKYEASHPEFYNSKKTQLCMTNEEMIKYFILEVENLLDEYPNAKLIPIIQEDNNDRCTCSNCLEATEKYGTYGGLNIVFINKVAEEVDKWLAVNYPKRTMIYETYAYFETEKAPVTYDEATGVYSPVCEEVKSRDNVRVKLASIGMPYGYSINEDVNKTYLELLKGWSAVCNNLGSYGYFLNYNTYFVGFDNFNATQDNYRTYFEHGSQTICENGAIRSNVPCLAELKAYVHSRLMWDTSLNYENLVDEFLRAYFKDGYEAMREYYDLYRDKMMDLKVNSKLNGAISEQLFQAKYWPKDLVDKFQSIVNEGLTAIEKYKDTDKVLYENLKFKLQKESLMQTAMYQYFYSQYFSKEQNKAMIDEFEDVCVKAEIYYYNEPTPLPDIITGWRNNHT